MKSKRLYKYYYLRLKRLREDPKILAGGTAIGVLVGLTPTMPLHTLLVIALTIITRTSTIAGIIISLIICNPLTYFPIYYFSVFLGNLFTPYEINWSGIQIIFDQLVHSDSIIDSINIVAHLGYKSLVVMVTGGIIMALPFAISSYYISLYIFKYLNSKRRNA